MPDYDNNYGYRMGARGSQMRVCSNYSKELWNKYVAGTREINWAIWVWAPADIYNSI